MSFVATWVPPFKSAISNEGANFIPFSLATISKDGLPKVRTCVFRGFLFDDESTNILTFCTDKRMAKLDELKSNNKYEACFYFGKSNKQYRFSGFTKIIDLDFLKTKEDINMIQTRSSTDLKLGFTANSENTSKNVVDRLRGTESSKVDFQNSPETDFSLYNEGHDSYRVFSPSTTSADAYLSSISFDVDSIPPPTKEEWLAEIHRSWNNLSSGMKASFRKPAPGSALTNEKRLQLDAISRGVDGESDDHGLNNFGVVLLFVDNVDIVDLDGANGAGRRVLFERVERDQWNSNEVCP